MHPPSLEWPGLQNPLAPTAADHAAHTTHPGVHRPEDLGFNGKKHKGALMKAMKKPLKQRHTRTKSRRKRDD